MAVKTYDSAASVQGLALRIIPLLPDGSPDRSRSYFTTNQFLSLAFTPEYEEGDEITEKNADGSICVQYKATDVLKKVTLDFSICAPEPEVYELLAGGTILTDTIPGAGGNAPTDTLAVGWAAPVVGSGPSNPVCIEVWSRAVTGGKTATDRPYWHWVFPQCDLRLTGDRTLENGLMANGFEGNGSGNTAVEPILATGGGFSAPWGRSTASPYQYARVADLPTGRGSAPMPQGTVADTTPPGLVSNITSSPAATSVVLNWTNPTDNDLDHIVVRRATGATPPVSVSTGTEVVLDTPKATTVTDTGLTASTEYSYAVFAVDAAGNTSNAANHTVTTIA